ncbi:MAG: nucleotidyltransferase, partial [Lachnospiraceae bacterium]|nr:nucleotidyltransferase [Lachnospiraceae bacterium]
NTTLLIMAAGIGSRFGEGIKQLTPLGPHGEIIIDYSIEEAINAGFDKVVFIIRKDIEKDFKEIIGHRIEKKIKCEYVYQELDKLPNGFKPPVDRKKPYGTAHAVLCAKEYIKEPFIVINADDYYGKEGFKKIHDFLVNEKDKTADGKQNLCMAGFIVGNTLSENGAVTRGVCKVDDNHNLISVTETFEISKKDGKIVGEDENKNPVVVDADAAVSMNMWGLRPEFLDSLEDRFVKFLENNNDNIKSEFLLPQVIDDMLKENAANVKVLPVSDKWYGVTYASDKEYVKAALKKIYG